MGNNNQKTQPVEDAESREEDFVNIAYPTEDTSTGIPSSDISREENKVRRRKKPYIVKLDTEYIENKFSNLRKTGSHGEFAFMETSFKVLFDNDSKLPKIKTTCNKTFFKLKDKIVLKKNVILIGNNEIYLEHEETTHSLKITIPPKIGGRISINLNNPVNPTTKSLVRFGRSKKSEIVVDEGQVSRTHCVVIHQDKDWVLYDGLPGKPSKDGVWVLLDQFFPLHEGMLVKRFSQSCKV